MFRTSDIVLIAVMVSAAAFTYKTKREAEDQLAEVRKIEAQIRYEQDTIDLLKADWSLLTQPSRLQKLAEIYQAELAAAAGRGQPDRRHRGPAAEAGRHPGLSPRSGWAAWPTMPRKDQGPS